MRFSDRETHYRIVRSTTPVTADGYKLGEPIEVECDYCGARAGHIDGLPRVHWPWCKYVGAVEVDDVHGPGFDGAPHR
jgi:hypothetical protein